LKLERSTLKFSRKRRKIGGGEGRVGEATCGIFLRGSLSFFRQKL